MTFPTRHILAVVGMVSALSIVAFGWRISLKNRQLASENAALRGAMETPRVIRNFEPDILPYLDALPPVPAAGASVNERFIFVSRSTCPYCARQLPFWKRMVDLMLPRQDAEVWLISLDGSEAFGDMPGLLASNQHPYREFTARSIQTFSLCTGIQGVPTTIVTTANRVVLFHAGLLTEQLMGTISDILHEQLVSARFPPFGRTEPVLK
jgi:hypothetical protein